METAQYNRTVIVVAGRGGANDVDFPVVAETAANHCEGEQGFLWSVDFAVLCRRPHGSEIIPVAKQTQHTLVCYSETLKYRARRAEQNNNVFCQTHKKKKEHAKQPKMYSHKIPKICFQFFS